MSLKLKLIILVTAIIFFFGFLANLFVFNYANKIFVQEKKDNLIEINTGIIKQIAQTFELMNSTVKTIANRPKLIDFLEKENRDLQDKEILDFLNNYNLHPSFLSIYILDSKGNTLVSTDKTFVGNNYSFRKYFKDAIFSGKTCVDVALGVTSKELGYYFSSPIKSAEGDNVGVLVIKTTPNLINEPFIFEDTLGKKFNFFFANEDGIIVYTNKKDSIYKSLGVINSEKILEIKEERSFTGLEIESLSYDLLQNSMFFVEGVELYDLNKDKKILTIGKVGQYPFYLVLEKETADFFKPALSLSYVLVFFVAIAAVMANLLILFLLTRSLRPLKIISDSAFKISKGDYSVKIEENNSTKEFNVLANSFNKMVLNIRKNREQIKKKVEERTSELKEINKVLIGRELKMLELKKENKKFKNIKKNENKK